MSSPPSFSTLSPRGGRCKFPSHPPPHSRARRRGTWGLTPLVPLHRVSPLDEVGACVRIFGAFSERFHHLLRIRSNLQNLELNPITAYCPRGFMAEDL